jgi:hypothetical protein
VHTASSGLERFPGYVGWNLHEEVIPDELFKISVNVFLYLFFGPLL